MINVTPLNKEDFLSSLSLLLVSLPLSAGIAVASGASPEAGIITAIFGAFFFGLFSSSPLAVFGPAAGLSAILSTSANELGGFSYIPLATCLAGIILMICSYFNVYQLINLFPKSVTRGMVAGIGLILMLKMLPVMFGYNQSLLFDGELGDSSRSMLINIWKGLQHINSGAVIIAAACLLTLIVLEILGKKVKASTHLSTGVIAILVGVAINLIFKQFFPGLYLEGEHLLHVNSRAISLIPSFSFPHDWTLVFKTGLIIATVIFLEGFITLDVFQKIDPLHSRVKYKREMFLLGIGNLILGSIGALPLMPVFIRSNANVTFGARSQNSVLLHGLWLVLALVFSGIFSYIPMASVAVVLFTLGIRLMHLKQIPGLVKRGFEAYGPFLLTVGFIFFYDLVWGIVAGFVMGLIFTLKSSFQHSMVLVNDEERYLLKFHKDVTFLHKAELREHLESIPFDKEILIDGTGNIYVDEEIEDWLVDFAKECKSHGCKVTFFKSKLAISRLFKENL